MSVHGLGKYMMIRYLDPWVRFTGSGSGLRVHGRGAWNGAWGFEVSGLLVQDFFW